VEPLRDVPAVPQAHTRTGHHHSSSTKRIGP
jgi:hypothetical protein